MPLPDPFGFVFDFFEKKEEPKSPKNAEEENKRPPFVINTLTDSHEQLRTHKPGFHFIKFSILTCLSLP